jgi:hypothetical protein
MVNFREPIVLFKDFGTYASEASLWIWNDQVNPFFNSGASEALACFRWRLFVCCLPFTGCSSDVIALLVRWEFFTTMDFEWNVIRGRRPYRWTIWVRGDVSLWNDLVPGD